MPSEASRKKALEIVGASVLEHDEDCGRLATPTYSGQCDCGFEVLADEIAAALDETRAEGVAEGEKRGAVEQVKVDAGNAMLAWMEQTSASLTDQVRGRCAEAGYDLILAALRECCERERGACYREIDDAPPEIRYLVAARGPMRGPEEHEFRVSGEAFMGEGVRPYARQGRCSLCGKPVAAHVNRCIPPMRGPEEE